MEPASSLGRHAAWRALCLLGLLLQVQAAADRTARGHAALTLARDHSAEQGAVIGAGHGAEHGTVHVLEAANTSAHGAIEPFPVPDIRHYKEAGNGYLEHSPLYARQEAKKLTQELAGPKPAVLEKPTATYRRISTTMECVINLTGQFFFVYTAWFVVQALNRLKMIDREREERCLVAVVETVFFVPMLCVLFLACRLRALQLTQGDPASHELPPWYVKLGMLVCTWSVFCQTLLVFVCTMAHGELWEAVVRKQGIGRAGKVMMVVRNVLMFLIYAGFTTVCVGTVLMQPGLDHRINWGKAGGPPVSPAVQCTIVLTVSYFAVYLALACARLSNEVGLMGQTLRFSSAQELLIAATATVAFAPMLSVLFMAARIQALLADFRNGNPQRWVQLLFYACTGSILLQASLAVGSALFGPRDREDSQGYPRPMRSVSTLYQAGSPMDILRSISVMVIHISVGLILVGLWVGRPRGPDGYETMPIPLQCTMGLTALYFLVHLALWAVRNMQRSKTMPGSVSPIHGGRDGDLSVLEVFLGVRAKEAVAFCPMFCILFLSTLMRSLQISGNKGAPPQWSQNLTLIATWSIVFLTLARVDVLIPRANRAITALCTATQYICLLLLYLSAIAIVAALFTMTAEHPAHSTIPASL